MHDRRLFAGDVSSLLAGELVFKIFHVVSRPDWTPASEFLGGGISFSHDAVDSLVVDSILLVAAWSAGSLLSHRCLGFLPANKRELWDASVTTTISAANILLVTVLLCAVLGSRAGALTVIDYWETLGASSLGAALLFRGAYGSL